MPAHALLAYVLMTASASMSLIGVAWRVASGAGCVVLLRNHVRRDIAIIIFGGYLIQFWFQTPDPWPKVFIVQFRFWYHFVHHEGGVAA